jgi:hypothetical protein
MELKEREKAGGSQQRARELDREREREIERGRE